MEVKPGYKRTEVGVIPEDWEAANVGSIARFTSGSGISVANLHRQSTDFSVPVFGGNGIAGYTRTPLIRERTVVIGRVGQKCGEVYITDRPAWISDNALFPRRMHRDCDIAFFALALQAATLNDVRNRNDLPLVTQSIVHAIKLAWPSTIGEQRAIATTLSDVDGLLSGLDRLVSKKHDLKMSTMQQLFTGDTRLPGFDGEWSRKPLGRLIVQCFSGATPSRNRPDYFKGNIHWITSGELNYSVITDTAEKISSEAVKRTNLAIVPQGTFLMAITGLEAEGTRGACGIVGVPSTTNQSCMAVFPTADLITKYLFYYYLFRGKSLAFQYCQGTKQQSYTAKLVKQLPIDLPPTIAEQSAIAEVLTDMDAEITALEQRREKTRALKQAMMQELLTGKTRLI